LISNEIAMNSVAGRKLLEEVIARHISFFQFDEKSRTSDISFYCDDSSLVNNANFLKEISQFEHFRQIITSLKEYLGEKFYKSSSYRYDAVYTLMWHCAQKISYQDFYKAWHS